MAENTLPLLTFADAAGFERWLDDHSEASAGAWLRFAKQSAPEATLSKSDAIDCALAHGWVDGQLGRVDAHFFKTRFTPRRPRSIWSQVNRGRVQRLEQAGRMRAAGACPSGGSQGGRPLGGGLSAPERGYARS